MNKIFELHANTETCGEGHMTAKATSPKLRPVKLIWMLSRISMGVAVLLITYQVFLCMDVIVGDKRRLSYSSKEVNTRSVFNLELLVHLISIFIGLIRKSKDLLSKSISSEWRMNPVMRLLIVCP